MSTILESDLRDLPALSFLLNNVPDQNSLSQLKLKNVGSCEYFCYSSFRNLTNYFRERNDFSLLHINVRSLAKNHDVLSACLKNLDFTFGVIGLTETWLTDKYL